MQLALLRAALASLLLVATSAQAADPPLNQDSRQFGLL